MHDVQTTDEHPDEPTTYSLAVLRGLQRLPNVYQGTVPARVKARRRAKGRAARHARKINRHG